MKKLEIETVPIDALIVDPKNVRKHPEPNLEDIRESLDLFGLQKPLVVGPHNVVVAGNGTLQAARELGWTHIDIVRTKLTGDKLRKYAVADNRSGETATWDDKALAELLQSLPELDGTGFDQSELDALLASLPDDSHPYGRHFPPVEGEVQCPQCGHRFVPEE